LPISWSLKTICVSSVNLTPLLSPPQSISLQSPKGCSFFSISSFFHLQSLAGRDYVDRYSHYFIYILTPLYCSNNSFFYSFSHKLRQFAIMIVPSLSTVLLASMGVVSVANAYSPNFMHVRAALERRQVRAQKPRNCHLDMPLTGEVEPEQQQQQWQ
jgi:hypothetical protein